MQHRHDLDVDNFLISISKIILKGSDSDLNRTVRLDLDLMFIPKGTSQKKPK